MTCIKGGRFLIKTGPPNTCAQQFGILLKYIFCVFCEYSIFSVEKAHLCMGGMAEEYWVYARLSKATPLLAARIHTHWGKRKPCN